MACAIMSARFHRRHAGRRSRVIAPRSSRQPACRPPRLTISFLRKYVLGVVIKSRPLNGVRHRRHGKERSDHNKFMKIAARDMCRRAEARYPY